MLSPMPRRNLPPLVAPVLPRRSMNGNVYRSFRWPCQQKSCAIRKFRNAQTERWSCVNRAPEVHQRALNELQIAFYSVSSHAEQGIDMFGGVTDVPGHDRVAASRHP